MPIRVCVCARVVAPLGRDLLLAQFFCLFLDSEKTEGRKKGREISVGCLLHGAS